MGFTLGLYPGYIGIVENEMETTLQGLGQKKFCVYTTQVGECCHDMGSSQIQL